MSTKTRKPQYEFECAVLSHPAKEDRFYMDMRVYRIVKPDVPVVLNNESLVWHGLYLALDLGNKGWIRVT